MSLYNALFGQNPASDVILATLLLSSRQVGRLRNVWVEKDSRGEPRIAVYTRNGGGNRDCWHYDNPEWGNEDCVGEPYEVEADETVTLPYNPNDPQLPDGHTWINVFVGSRRGALTGRRVMETRHTCDRPGSEWCACVGCIITYRLPKHPAYLFDRDDDFDPTYATVYFSLPPAFAEPLAAIAADEPFDPSAAWEGLIAGLEEGTKA